MGRERMNRPAETTQKVDRVALFKLSETRLHGTWLITARVAWLAIVGMDLALYIISIPSYFAYLHTVCIPGQCDLGYQLTAQDIRQLQFQFCAMLKVTFFLQE